MKVKKQKRHRKFVRFYTACFGFRQPFKVLCDGTFVHHLLVNRITPADKALVNILGDPVKLYTTRCVLVELRRLGNSHSDALEAAHKLLIARCEHEKGKSGDACIMEVVGQNNSEHFFVASQDTDLRKQLEKVTGVPLIFGLRNALFLESPSALQRQYVKTSEETRSHMTNWERQINDRIMTRLASEEATINTDEDKYLGDQNIDVQAEKQASATRKRKQIDVKDRPQFKRKKAKNPNPLSCKKKKKRESQNTGPLKEMKEGDNTGKSSRKRKRSRRRREPTETNSL